MIMKQLFGKSQSFFIGILLDALCALLLSSGCAAAVLPLIVPGSGAGICVMYAAFALLLIVPLSLRWWLAPVAAASATCAVCVLLWRNAFGAGLELCRSFIYWIVSGAPSGYDAANPLYPVILRFIIVFGINLLFYILVRKLFTAFETFAKPHTSAFIAFAILALLCAAVFLTVNSMMPSDLSVQVCLCSAGLIIILPRVFVCVISEREESELTFADARISMQAVAVPAAVMAVLLALLLTPLDTSGWKSQELTGLINEIYLTMRGPFAKWPEESSNFSYYSIGEQSEQSRMGGPVSLSDKRYLTVFAEKPVLLKGRVLDYYTGNSWLIAAPDGDLRIKSAFWADYRGAAFDIGKPEGPPEAKELYQRLTSETKLTIRVDKQLYNTLFFTGASPDIRFDKWKRLPEAYFNMRSELYLHSAPPNRSEYTLTSRIWNTDSRDFDRLFTELERLTGGGDAQLGWFYTRCTQLPDELPEDVRSLAHGITEGIESPYMKAKAISEWLSDNCRYTLEPDTPPEGVDFTAYFLETREGYCVYYATAMTVLARCVGLPARYVQGFALEIDASGDGSRYAATGKTAHAWSEVYFEGIGWVPFDPLSWRTDAPLNADLVAAERETEAVTPYTGAEHGAALSAAAAKKYTQGRDWKRYIIAGAAAVALLLAVSWAVSRRKSRLWTAERVRRRFSDTRIQLDEVYRDTLKLLALFGLTAEPLETLVTFPERVDRFIKLDDSAFSDIAAVVSCLHFAEEAPSAADVENACEYHLKLERAALMKLGRLQYFFRRVLAG